jgi:O-antigen ligase
MESAAGGGARLSLRGRYLSFLIALGWCAALGWLWAGAPWEVRLIGLAWAIAGVARPGLFLGVLALALPWLGNQPGATPSLLTLEMALMGPVIHHHLRRALGLTPARTNRADPWLLLFVGYSWLAALHQWRYIECELLAEGRRFLYTNLMHYGTSPTFGFQAAFKLTLGVSFYQSLRDNPLGAGGTRRFLWLALGGLALDSALGLLHYAGWIALDWWRPDNPDLARFGIRRLETAFGHPGWFAQYLAIVAPAALALGWADFDELSRVAARRWERWLGWGLAVALVFVQFLTMQRGGWLALAAGYGVVLVAGTLAGDAKEKLGGGWRRALMTAGAFVAVLGVCGAVAALTNPDFRQRFGELLAYRHRTQIWESAWLLGRKEWATGVGLGNYYVTHCRVFPWGHEYFFLDKVTAHSLYVHAWVERGAIGLFLLLAVLVDAFRMLGNGLRGRGGNVPRWAMLAAAGGLTAFVVEGLVQYVFYIRGVAVLFWILLAITAWSSWSACLPRPSWSAWASSSVTEAGARAWPRGLWAGAMLGLAVFYLWTNAGLFDPWKIGVGIENLQVGDREVSLLVPSDARRVRLTLGAVQPGLESAPQELTVTTEGREPARVVFRAPGVQTVDVDLAGEPVAGRRIVVTASRVWSPLRESGERFPPLPEIGVLYLEPERIE